MVRFMGMSEMVRGFLRRALARWYVYVGHYRDGTWIFTWVLVVIPKDILVYVIFS